MRSAAPPPRDSAGFIPWWLLGLVAAACLSAALVFAAAAALTRSADLPRPTATVVLVTLPAAAAGAGPTDLAPSATPGGAVEAPTATPPAPPPGDVQIGVYVQVTGTGDAGFLNLRSEPNLQAGVNYLALEREVFQVQAGPAEADGFVWWYLVDPATGSRFGWGVQNYLQVVQGP